LIEQPLAQPIVDENASADATAGCFQAIAVAMLTVLMAVVATLAGVWMLLTFSPLSTLDYLPIDEAAGRVAIVVLDDIGESPGLDPASPAREYPIDTQVPDVYTEVLERAFDLVRATDEGERLFEVLIDNDVLVSVENIPYNAGYTQTRWSALGWVDSRVVIDSDAVRSRDLDSLASILIHEAVHVDRAVDGSACFYADACEELANGVNIEEEIAAHAIQAVFWRELYGSDGKRFAFGPDSGENALLDAWHNGTAAFERYVREIRGDDREGIGI